MTIGLIGAPFWQGQTVFGVNHAPAVLRRAGLETALREHIAVHDYGDLPVLSGDCCETVDPVDPVRRAAAVAENVTRLRDRVATALDDGCLPVVLGGDHSVSIGTLAALLRRYPSLGVIWFDAHADINTPASSPSGNIHGMPLAVAMGMGDARLTAVGEGAPRLLPRNLVYVGLRDVDAGEADLMQALGIRSYSADDVRRLGMAHVAAEAQAYLASCDGIHLSFDYDGLDPRQFAAVGTPAAAGLTLAEGRLLLEALGRSGRLLAAEFVEYNPAAAPAVDAAATAVSLIGHLFGAPDALLQENAAGCRMQK